MDQIAEIVTEDATEATHSIHSIRKEHSPPWPELKISPSCPRRRNYEKMIIIVSIYSVFILDTMLVGHFIDLS